MNLAHLGPGFGNIGDNLSHVAVRACLRSLIPEELEIWPIDIRDYYFNAEPRRSLTELLGQSWSRIWCGGGALLDPGWPTSASGTTIDIPASHLDERFVLFGVGSLTPRAWDHSAANRLIDWLDKALSRGVNISLRNDGSLRALTDFAPVTRSSFANLNIVADPAFLLRIPELRSAVARRSAEQLSSINRLERPYVLLAPAGDAIDDRSGYASDFLQHRSTARSILETTDLDVVFIPHTLQDVQAIADMTIGMDSVKYRRRISIFGVQWRSPDISAIVELYGNATAVISSRLHGCILSLALDTPVAAAIGHRALASVAEFYEVPRNNPQYFDLTELQKARDSWSQTVDLESQNCLEAVKNIVSSWN